MNDERTTIHPLIIRTVLTLDKINYLTAKITSWFALPMMLSLICEVVMRYFFQKPTIWAMNIAIILFCTCLSAEFIISG